MDTDLLIVGVAAIAFITGFFVGVVLFAIIENKIK